MNPIASEYKTKIASILAWFARSIDSIDQFGEYDQLQLIICAHELGFDHPNISRKVKEVERKPEANSVDYVFQFLEQLVLMKYKVGESRQKRYFDYWIQEENSRSQSDLTKAYHSGYLVMEENQLSTPELKQKAINWLKNTRFLPSMSLTAWTAFYLENHNEQNAAQSRFDELMSLRQKNGSWNNLPFQTIQIAHPLSLTRFGNDEGLALTIDFILSQPWEGFSGDIRYETGLIKWLKAKEFI